MELSNAELQEFRDRCLRASIHGHQIALADLYVEALAPDCEKLAEVVPEGLTRGSAEHLLAMADEALDCRARGVGRKVKTLKATKADARRGKSKDEPKLKEEEPPPPAPAPEPVISREEEISFEGVADDDDAPKKSSVPKKKPGSRR